MRQHKKNTSETARIYILNTTMANDLLLYNNGYWEEKLGREFQKKKTSKKTTTTPISAIVDVQGGAEIWQQGKFSEFIKATTYDPALGYPIDSPEDHDTCLDTQTVFDNTISNPLHHSTYVDVHGDESGESGIGSLGGGGEFSTGEIAM